MDDIGKGYLGEFPDPDKLIDDENTYEFNLQVGYKWIDYEDFDPGTGNISGGGNSPYKVDSTVDGIETKVGVRYNVGWLCKLDPSIFVNYTRFQGTNTKTERDPNPDSQAGVLTVNRPLGGFTTNGQPTKNKLNITTRNNRVVAGMGFRKNIGEKISFMGELGVVGEFNKLHQNSTILTDGINHWLNTETTINKTGVLLGGEVARDLPWGVVFGVGGDVTPVHVRVKTSADDRFTNNVFSHRTTNKRTLTADFGVHVRITKEFWKNFRFSAIFDYVNSYFPEFESVKVFPTGEPFDIHNGRANELGISAGVEISPW